MLIIKLLEQCSEEEKREAYAFLSEGSWHNLALTEIEPGEALKIGAIKLIRERLGWFLKEAKDQVEAGMVRIPDDLSEEALASLRYSLVLCGYKLGA